MRAAAHQEPAVVLVDDSRSRSRRSRGRASGSARRSSSACARGRRPGSARRAPSPDARGGSRTGSSGTTRRRTCSTRSGRGAAARTRVQSGLVVVERVGVEVDDLARHRVRARAAVAADDAGLPSRFTAPPTPATQRDATRWRACGRSGNTPARCCSPLHNVGGWPERRAAISRRSAGGARRGSRARRRAFEARCARAAGARRGSRAGDRVALLLAKPHRLPRAAARRGADRRDRGAAQHAARRARAARLFSPHAAPRVLSTRSAAGSRRRLRELERPPLRISCGGGASRRVRGGLAAATPHADVARCRPTTR